MTDAFHDKYRPTTFSDVVGQEDVIKSLKRVVKDKRAHSFIFVGPSGTGKTTLARILANEFAGKQATAANIQEVAAADLTGVDDMRAVISKSHYRAIGSSSVRAFIIDEAHRLSKQAWDVLLKPVEEPPAHVYWMFCTTEEGRIPKTIQTRCLKFNLKPVSEEHLLEVLLRVIELEGLEIDEEVLEAIIENSGGSPRQALINLEVCQYCESGTEALKKLRAPSQSKEVIDLCRYLIRGRGKNWKDVIRILKDLEETDAESIRINIVNYIAVVLMSTNRDSEVARLLSVLECFSESYNTSDKMAPLLLSVGEALGLGSE